jgi:hypothetical protein
MADIFDVNASNAMRDALADPPPAEAIIPDPLVPVPMDHLDWNNYIEKYPIDEPGFCFWCHYAQTKQQYVGNKNVEKLVNFHRENFNNIHPFDFARKMQKLYRRYIQPWLIDHTGKVCLGPEWSGIQIVQHTTLHIINPPDVVEAWMRVIVRSTQVMADNGIFLGSASKPGVIQGIDSKVFSTFMKTIKEAKPFLDKLSLTRNKNLYGIV